MAGSGLQTVRGRLWGRRAVMGMLAAVAAAGIATAAAAAEDVVLTPVDHPALRREIARHRGTVVVLDCWSTSCPPCVAEFPGLVRLAAAHRGEVVCLSVALDYDGVGRVEDTLPAVRDFLEQVGAGDVVNMIATEEADSMYRQLDLTGVPTVFIWRQDGTLAARFDDDFAAKSLGRPFTYADVEQTVAGLLAAAGR
ncbi:MAG: TlpA family protein disulfide reductase [Planctomycetaceae bacterium]